MGIWNLVASGTAAIWQPARQYDKIFTFKNKKHRWKANFASLTGWQQFRCQQPWFLSVMKFLLFFKVQFFFLQKKRINLWQMVVSGAVILHAALWLVSKLLFFLKNSQKFQKVHDSSNLKKRMGIWHVVVHGAVILSAKFNSRRSAHSAWPIYQNLFNRSAHSAVPILFF